MQCINIQVTPVLPHLLQLGAKPGAATPGMPAASLAPQVGAAVPADRAAAAAAVAAAMLPPGAPAPQLGGVPAAGLTAAALGAKPKPATRLPPPLILDDQGRELDPATGRPVEKAAPAALQAPAAQQQQQDDAAAAAK